MQISTMKKSRIRTICSKINRKKFLTSQCYMLLVCCIHLGIIDVVYSRESTVLH